jgi:hypothetical protein
MEVPDDLYYCDLNPKIWDDLTGPSGGLTFASKIEFHPGHADLVCLIDAGPVEIDFGTGTSVEGGTAFKGSYARERVIQAVRVLSKDQPVSTFRIELTKEEIEGGKLKAFVAS